MEAELISLLLDSSSSSSTSTSDDEVILEILGATVPRNRIINFRNVIENYEDEEFRENFRMHKQTAFGLIDQFGRSEFFRKKAGGGGKKEIPADIQMFMFLWFAGNKDSYREVANLFNVAISSAYRSLTNILDFMFNISKSHIKFPRSEEEKLRVSQKFEQVSNFPNVLGCIDGCFISTRKPSKKIRSLTVQGICDADNRFIDIFICSPSRIHEARVYQLSSISKDLPDICGEEYHLLGDASYPLRECLLTPYKQRSGAVLKIKQKRFNKILSQTREKIDNSFGMLKNRFRQLLRMDFFAIERMCKFVVACCVLHNMCIGEGDIWLDYGPSSSVKRATVENAKMVRERDSVLRKIGVIKRNELADRFSSNIM